MKNYLKIVASCPMLAEVAISYKSKVKFNDRTKINQSSDVYKYLKSIWDQNTLEHSESMYLLLLNRKNQILGWKQISSGGVSGCIADPKIIFQIALLANATSLILAHNHPSGNLQPSK